MGRFRNDKKGFLLGEETLKIIIAVICIVFLIWLLIAIYNSSTADKKIDQAKAILSRTDSIISSLSEGGDERQDIANPEGWHLYSFARQEKPNFCAGEKCICICEKALINQINSQTKKCDKRGTCLIIPELAVAEIDFKITGTNPLLFIDIKKQNGRVFIEKSK